jgi:hypothetical protein
MLNEYLLECSPKQLMSLRASARPIIAYVSIFMLLQACTIAYKLLHSVDETMWTSNGLIALVLCYAMGSIVSGVGGLCGLYSSRYHHSLAAQICLTSWILLMLLQVVEAVIALGFALPDSSRETRQIIAWNTLALVSMESVFIVFLFGYIRIIQSCDPREYITIEDGDVGVSNMEQEYLIHDPNLASSTFKSTTKTATVLTYGSQSASYTV